MPAQAYINQPFIIELDGDPNGISLIDLNTATTIHARLENPAGDVMPDITTGIVVATDVSVAEITIPANTTPMAGNWKIWLRVDFGLGFIPGTPFNFVVYTEGT